jgi:hypothetical protein
MVSEELGLWARLWLVIVIPWKILFDAALAARIHALARPAPGLSAGEAETIKDMPAVTPAVTPAATPAAPSATAALQLLAILQREGRFVDFLQEDVAGFSDAEVGAAARVVHDGCRRGLKDYLELEPVRGEAEGAAVVLERGFDPARTRVTGNVVGEPPFKGRLAHHGWQVKELRLPVLSAGHDPTVVAPAEVEL